MMAAALMICAFVGCAGAEMEGIYGNNSTLQDVAQNTTIFTSPQRQALQEELRQEEFEWDIELKAKEKILYANQSEGCVPTNSNVYRIAYGEGFADNVSVPGNLSRTSEDVQVLAMNFIRDDRITENGTGYLMKALVETNITAYVEVHEAFGPAYVYPKPAYQLLEPGERMLVDGLGGVLLPVGVAPVEVGYCKVEKPWISRELTGIKEIRLIRDDTGLNSSPYIQIDSIIYKVDESLGKRWPSVNVTCHGVGNENATRVVISKLTKTGHAETRSYSANIQGNDSVTINIPLKSENPERITGFEIESQGRDNSGQAVVR